MRSTNIDWIEAALPRLRCPDTHQSLRWAQADDLSRHGLAADATALVNADGTRLFPIDAGIPILLPQATQSTP